MTFCAMVEVAFRSGSSFQRLVQSHCFLPGLHTGAEEPDRAGFVAGLQEGLTGLRDSLEGRDAPPADVVTVPAPVLAEVGTGDDGAFPSVCLAAFIGGGELVPGEDYAHRGGELRGALVASTRASAIA